MDDNLAFCLECFAEEQMEEPMKEIEQLVQKLEAERTEVFQQIKQDEQRLCTQENALLEQLCKELHLNDGHIFKTRQLLVHELRNLFAHLSDRLNTLASGSVPREAEEEMRDASNRLRHQNEQFESEMVQLIQAIDQTNTYDYEKSINQWYQRRLAYIDQLYRRIHTKDDPKKFPMDPLKRCVRDRLNLWEDRSRFVSDFLQQFQCEDMATRQVFYRILQDRTGGILLIVQRLRSQMEKYQAQRRHKNEELLDRLRAQLEQKREESQHRAIQLAGALRRLAVGSDNAKKFDDKFRQIVNQTDQFVPVILEDIDQLTSKALPMTIRLDADFHTWASNEASIQESFCAELSNALDLPQNSIRIVNIVQGSVILHTQVRSPYGKQVLDQLVSDRFDADGNPGCARRCIERIEATVERFKGRLSSITLGDTGLDVKDAIMNPTWNRVYVSRYGEPGGTYWKGAIDRGGKPYYCPKGWKRFAVKVSENDVEFDSKWGSWNLAYHGTQGRHALAILNTGLKATRGGCYLPKGKYGVFLTPSIEYAAHPRYSRPWQRKGKNNRWYQLVFQCRVKPQAVGKTRPETLLEDEHKKIVIDENFSNNEVEWIIPAEKAVDEYIRENIICYGMMIRVSECDPKDLPPSRWWRYAGCHGIPYDSVH